MRGYLGNRSEYGLECIDVMTALVPEGSEGIVLLTRGRAVLEHRHLHQSDLAVVAAVHRRGESAPFGIEAVVLSDDQSDSGMVCGIDEFLRLDPVIGEALLNEYVLAGIEGGVEIARMQLHRSGDNHCIAVHLFERGRQVGEGAILIESGGLECVGQKFGFSTYERDRFEAGIIVNEIDRPSAPSSGTDVDRPDRCHWVERMIARSSVPR